MHYNFYCVVNCKVEYVVSVFELTDRFALENHDTNSGVVDSDNLRKFRHCCTYIQCLNSDSSYRYYSSGSK